jgi:hypothetical protein
MTCKIEGLPDGWEVVGFRQALPGEYYLGGQKEPSQWNSVLIGEKSSGTYVIVRRKEKTLVERFDEWVKANDIKAGSKVKVTRAVRAAEFPQRGMADDYDYDRLVAAADTQTVINLYSNTGCLRVTAGRGDAQIPFEVCEPVKKVLKPWDMDTMPERVKVKHKVHGNLVYWARPTGIEHAVVGATNVMTYRDLLANYTQADGSPCGIEVDE